MRTPGQTRSDHFTRAKRIASILLAGLLAACDADEVDRPLVAFAPDAAVDAFEPACPAGVSTWRDVLSYWDHIRCVTFARCFPDMFVDWYGDQAGCVAQVGRLHCKGGRPENWCELPYPRERCAALDACRADSEALACDLDAVVPESCETALR